MIDKTLLLTIKARSDRMIGMLDWRTRVTWACQAAIVRDARDVIVGRVQSIQRTLTALPPERLKVALYGLLLVETYVIATIILTVVTQFAYADALRYDRPPDQSGLVFLAAILLPSLLLGVHRLHKEAVAHTTERGEIEVGDAARQVSALDGAYRTLHLYPDAPLHIAEAAYIAAMKRAHPDVPGGSNDVAARLTLAIETIRASAGRRDAGGSLRCPGGNGSAPERARTGSHPINFRDDRDRARRRDRARG